MQKDFIDGALGTEEAMKIVEPVAVKIRQAKEQGTDIVFTKDTHYKDYLMTQEGRKLPVPHCVKGTEGWELDAGLKELAKDCRILEKPSFGSLELAALVRRRELRGGRADRTVHRYLRDFQRHDPEGCPARGGGAGGPWLLCRSNS